MLSSAKNTKNEPFVAFQWPQLWKQTWYLDKWPYFSHLLFELYPFVLHFKNFKIQFHGVPFCIMFWPANQLILEISQNSQRFIFGIWEKRKNFWAFCFCQCKTFWLQCKNYERFFHLGQNKTTIQNTMFLNNNVPGAWGVSGVEIRAKCRSRRF